MVLHTVDNLPEAPEEFTLRLYLKAGLINYFHSGSFILLEQF